MAKYSSSLLFCMVIALTTTRNPPTATLRLPVLSGPSVQQFNDHYNKNTWRAREEVDAIPGKKLISRDSNHA